MASFDQKSLGNLEKLCRFKFSQEERNALISNIQKILNYVDQLNEVNTDNVQPSNNILQDVQKPRMRDDLPKNTLTTDEFLLNAPEHIGGMVRVPVIINPNE